MIINGFFENVPRHLYEHRRARPGRTTRQHRPAVQSAPRHRHVRRVHLGSLGRARAHRTLWSFAAVSDEPSAGDRSHGTSALPGSLEGGERRRVARAAAPQPRATPERSSATGKRPTSSTGSPPEGARAADTGPAAAPRSRVRLRSDPRRFQHGCGRVLESCARGARVPTAEPQRVRGAIGLTLPQAFRELTGADDPLLAAEFSKRFVAHADRVMVLHTHVYPAVPALLASLRSRGVRLRSSPRSSAIESRPFSPSRGSPGPSMSSSAARTSSSTSRTRKGCCARSSAWRSPRLSPSTWAITPWMPKRPPVQARRSSRFGPGCPLRRRGAVGNPSMSSTMSAASSMCWRASGIVLP